MRPGAALSRCLEPGLVSILDTLPERPASIVEAHRAYWFYARNQSAWLDLEIVVRALLRRTRGEVRGTSMIRTGGLEIAAVGVG